MKLGTIVILVASVIYISVEKDFDESLAVFLMIGVLRIGRNLAKTSAVIHISK